MNARADVRMLTQACTQRVQELRAFARRVCHEILLVEDLQRAQRNGTPDRMAAVGVGVHPWARGLVQDRAIASLIPTPPNGK